MSFLPVPDFFRGAPQMTFGIELEFLLMYRKQQDFETDLDKLVRANPDLIIVPSDVPARRETAFLQTIISARLARSGFAVTNGSILGNPATDQGPPVTHSAPTGVSTAAMNSANTCKARYQRWQVVGDESVKPTATSRPLPTPFHRYVGLELVSPALTDCRASYDEVAAVATLVTKWYGDNVITSTDACAGFHVHVGMGRDMDHRNLRQIAALLWAVESLFTTLHPEERVGNRWCRPNRACARLAVKMQADLTAGVQALLDCGDAVAVATLMESVLGLRPAYAFQGFLRRETDPDRKSTIEFRQAAGTLNPRWVTVWARICVRTCAAAVAYSPDQLTTIARICESAELAGPETTAGGALTVGAFLRAIGCPDEAFFVEWSTPDGRVLSHGDEASCAGIGE